MKLATIYGTYLAINNNYQKYMIFKRNAIKQERYWYRMNVLKYGHDSYAALASHNLHMGNLIDIIYFLFHLLQCLFLVWQAVCFILLLGLT